MTAHLVACPGCARHVRVSEDRCPFCSSMLGDDVRATGPKRAPRERLGRAALVAFGAGTLAVACGGSVGQGAGEKDGGRADHETHESGFGDELIATLYGVAFDAGLPPDDGGKPDVGFAPPYGIAPMFDAGQGDAGQATDATLGEDVMIGADYGAPPNHG